MSARDHLHKGTEENGDGRDLPPRTEPRVTLPGTDGGVQEKLHAWRREFRRLTGVEPANVAAVRGWQRAHGLPESGTIRTSTISAARASAGEKAQDGAPQDEAGTATVVEGTPVRAGRGPEDGVEQVADRAARTSQASQIRQALRNIESEVDAESQMHADLIRLRTEQPIVAATSELAAEAGEAVSAAIQVVRHKPKEGHGVPAHRLAMPPRAMWSTVTEPLAAANQELRFLESTDPSDVVLRSILENLTKARLAYAECHRRLADYRGRTIAGAEAAEGGLRGVVAAAVLVESIAAGGVGASVVGAEATATAQLLAASTGAALGAGGATLVEHGAGRGAEVANGERKDFGWGDLLVEVGEEAATTFIASYLGGRLSRKFFELVGRRLASALPIERAAELAKKLAHEGLAEGSDAAARLGEILTTRGQKILIDFFSGVAITPLLVAISTSLALLHGKRVTVEEFTHEVVEESLRAGLLQLFVSAVLHDQAGAREPRSLLSEQERQVASPEHVLRQSGKMSEPEIEMVANTQGKQAQSSLAGLPSDRFDGDNPDGSMRPTLTVEERKVLVKAQQILGEDNHEGARGRKFITSKDVGPYLYGAGVRNSVVKPMDKIVGAQGLARNTDGLSAEETVSTLGLDYEHQRENRGERRPVSRSGQFTDVDANGKAHVSEIVRSEGLHYLEYSLTQRHADSLSVPVGEDVYRIAQTEKNGARGFSRARRRGADDPFAGTGMTSPCRLGRGEKPAINQELLGSEAQAIPSGTRLMVRREAGQDVVVARYSRDVAEGSGPSAPGKWTLDHGLSSGQRAFYETRISEAAAAAATTRTGEPQ